MELGPIQQFFWKTHYYVGSVIYRAIDCIKKKKHLTLSSICRKRAPKNQRSGFACATFYPDLLDNAKKYSGK